MNHLNIDWDQLTHVTTRDLLSTLLERAKQVQLIPDYISLDQISQLYEVFRANVRAMQAYLPGSYGGRVVYLKASEQPASFADCATRIWTELAAGGVESIVIPGNHYSIMREPDVKILGDRLQACILKAEEDAQ